MTHIDLIRLIIVPDPRKWSKTQEIYRARADPDNFPLIRALIDQGFFDGDSSVQEPRIGGMTWKGLDLYNATRLEGVRIRLTFRIGSTNNIDAIHSHAIAIHAAHGEKWNRRSKY